MIEYFQDASVGFVLKHLILVAYIFLWLYTLVHIAKNEFKENLGTIWGIVVVCMPLFGLLLYWGMSKDHRIIKN